MSNKILVIRQPSCRAVERGCLLATAFWRRVVVKALLQKALGTVVLCTIFILLGLRRAYVFY